MQYFICLLFIFSETIFAQKVYLNNPPTKPEMFLGNWINTGLNERDFALSPDGKEAFFTIVAPQNAFSAIFHIKKSAANSWSKPIIASFSGNYADLEPAFSPNGNQLYFVSKRPIDKTEKKDFDIWVINKLNGKWGEPVHLPKNINSEIDEFYPSIAKNGNLYFTAAYHEAESKEDIFMSKFENGEYQKPIALDSAINSKHYEFNAFIAPDESFLIFTAYGRKGDLGHGDLYISEKKERNWQIAKPISSINSEKLDYCPTISSNGKVLFFTSERANLPSKFVGKKAQYQHFNTFIKSPQNGLGDIYWVSFEQVLKTLRE